MYYRIARGLTTLVVMALITWCSIGDESFAYAFRQPVVMASASGGHFYVMDGTTISDQQGKPIANLIQDRATLAPWGLSDDVVTFKPASMVYQDGALFVSGFMLDRLQIPERLPAAASYDYFVKLGQVYYVFFRVDIEQGSFKPILVEQSGQWQIDSASFEVAYYGLVPSVGETLNLDYTKGSGPDAPRAPPNLVPTKDGAFLVAKNTVYSVLEPVNKARYRMSPRHFPLEWETTAYPGDLRTIPPGGLYKLWPDGRQQLLHHSQWFTLEMIQSKAEPVRIPIPIHKDFKWTRHRHAAFFETPDPNIVFCTGLWDNRRLDLRTHQYVNWSEPILWGSPLLGGEDRLYAQGGGFYPALIFTTDRPYLAADGNLYFLTESGIWCLRDFKYTQDLLRWKNPKVVAALGQVVADDIADWAISSDMKTIYLLSRPAGALRSYPMPPIPTLVKPEPASRVEFFEPTDPFWLRCIFYND